MKTWVNGELLNADKMNTLEQSVPASAISSNGVVTFKNGNGTDLFSVEVGAPAPTNMITNGDFSAAGATTDGWAATTPSRSSLSITNGRLVLTLDSPQGNTYGIEYNVQTIVGHTYLVKMKVKKTLNDNDSDGKVLNCLFGTTSTSVMRFQGISQDDVIESTFALTAVDNNSVFRFQFGGVISASATTAGDSMLELSYVKMYDITDIVAGWTA